jgi:alpha-L-fucosidase 2
MRVGILVAAALLGSGCRGTVGGITAPDGASPTGSGGTTAADRDAGQGSTGGGGAGSPTRDAAISTDGPADRGGTDAAISERGSTGGSSGSGGSGGSGGLTSTGGSGPPPGPEGQNAQALNRETGALDVDYAGFLSKHDIVFRQPNPNPLLGLTVGNGRTGAMVWSANGLTMQVSGVDVSEQTAFSAGLVNFQTTPAIDAGAAGFQQRLSLHDGTLTTSYGTDRTITIMGAPASEVIGIHVEDRRPAVAGAVLELSLWDVSTLGNSGAVPDLNTWKAISTYADATSAGLSRGQTDANHFGYTLAAAVDGTPFATQVVSPGRVRLTITPATSYTIWIACATRLNAPGNDSVARARNLLADIARAGYAATLAAEQTWWHAFWSRSFVQYAGTGGTADYLENVYYLSTYMIASGAYGRYPFHFINGVFRATGDNTKWSNAYWYWNQRDVYNSFLASNHPDVMRVFNDMYSGNATALRALTMTRYGSGGIWVPETMGWNGDASGTVGSDFTKNIYSTGVEAANNMYLQYRYTGDTTYLAGTAYPFMRDVANFYVGRLSRNATTGQYFMASSNSHETYWNVQNAITDLAAVRSLFPIAIETSQTLGLDAPARLQWQTILDNLAPYPRDAANYLPNDPPAAPGHNNENVACEIIWPYGVTGIGTSDYAMAVSTWRSRPFPYGNVWANDAIQAARLGLGDDTYRGLVTMLQRYQSYPNGMTNNTNGVFEYLGVHLSAMNEALLQSYNDKIRVFPAMPADATFIGRFTLMAKGGFLISSERDGTDIKYVGLMSTLGGTAHLVHPWTAQPAQVRRASDDAIVVTATTSAEFDLPTTAGAVYILERTAKPLSGYARARITGSANAAAKSLAGTPCTLGI